MAEIVNDAFEDADGDDEPKPRNRSFRAGGGWDERKSDYEATRGRSPSTNA